MCDAYSHFGNIATEIDLPPDGTLSRTIHNDERVKVVLFGFSAGQELSEHTSSSAAILHFLRGEADVTLGADKVIATAGTWIHMPSHLPHSIHTKTPVAMLLLLLKQSES